MSRKINLHTRCDAALADRADALASLLADQAGVSVSRPLVVREAIAIGLAEMERRAGIPAGPAAPGIPAPRPSARAKP